MNVLLVLGEYRTSGAKVLRLLATQQAWGRCLHAVPIARGAAEGEFANGFRDAGDADLQAVLLMMKHIAVNARTVPEVTAKVSGLRASRAQAVVCSCELGPELVPC